MRFTTIFISLVYSVVCLAQVDTAILESVLNSTFVEVVGYNEFLELTEVDSAGDEQVASKLSIDQSYTDFDKGRIKANLITQTVPFKVNLNEKLKLSIDVSTDITDTKDQRKSFDLNADIKIKGNTLPILKGISSVLGACTQEPIDENTANPVHLGNILCHVQTGINQAALVLDLQGGLQEAANYAKLVYGKTPGTDSVIGDLFSSLTITPDGNDLVLHVKVDTTINLNPGEANKNSLIANITLRIKEDGMDLHIDGSAVFEDRQLQGYIDMVKNIGTELSDRDSDTHIIYYEDNLYLIFALIEGFIIAEDEDEDTF